MLYKKYSCDKKHLSTLLLVLGWLLTGLLIFFVGIINTHAAEYNLDYSYIQDYFDNNGSSLTYVTTSWNSSLQSYVSSNITTTANSYGAAVGFNSPIPIIQNHNYSISIYFTERNNIALSSKNRITIGNSSASVKYNYERGEYWTTQNYSGVSNNSIISYNFTANGNASWILIPWTTTTTRTQNYNMTTIIIEDLGSNGVSESVINNSINNQTNILNNSILASTNTITGALNDTENNINNNINNAGQDIIDNQNQNNEKLIEELKKGQLTCGYNYKEEFKYSNLNNSGAIVGGNKENNSNFKYSDPTIIFGGYEYNVSGYNTGTSNRYLIAVYDSEMNYLFDFNYKNNTILDLSSYEGILYIVANVNSNEANNLVIVQKNGICVPTSYLQMKQNQETNNQLGNLNDSLTDSSPVSLDSLSDTMGWLPPGPIDSILTLPLAMLNSLSNALSKTCAPLKINIPFIHKEMQIPCLSTIFNQITGLNSFWNWVGVIASAMMLYQYLLTLYAWVDKVLTLRAEFDEAMGVDLANWGRL